MIEINDKVLEDIKSGFMIPPKPAILDEIRAILQSDDPSLTDLSQLVATDVGISSAILKVINSPFYGMKRSISDVNQAVFILGLNAVASLVTALKLRTAYIGQACISLELFWDNAVEIANAMVFIGNQLKNKIPLEDLYSLGLFHDAGIPALAIKYDDYVDVLQESNTSDNRTLVELEEKRYPTNHAIVGFYLASSWHLPKHLCKMILNHHAMDFFTSNTHEEKIQFAVLKMAENIVYSSKRYRNIPEWTYIEHEVYSYLGIDRDFYLDIAEDLSMPG